MKPLPNLEDEAAMLLRGRRSALMSARNEAVEEVRNLLIAVQVHNQVDLSDAAITLRELAQRFDALAGMEERIK
jgi:hypothetical protein